MREVSVRILYFSHELARVSGVDGRELFEGLPSVFLDLDGKYPDWIDWDDVVEIVERLERMLGGIEGVTRAMRDATPTSFPEMRAFGAVFVRPIPLFKFVLTRLLPSMYRNVRVSGVEELEGDRFRWRQSILEPYRASASFLRMSLPLVQLFPLHLDLPEARIESATITDREAEYVAAFPPSDPLVVRGAHAVSSTASVLAVQLDEAFARIVETVRVRVPGAESSGSSASTRIGSSRPPSPSASSPARVGAEWADRLSLSPRQRGVFTLLLEGRANKDIASVLQCSERNIEFHVGRIFRAARVSSRAELLVKVLGART